MAAVYFEGAGVVAEQEVGGACWREVSRGGGEEQELLAVCVAHQERRHENQQAPPAFGSRALQPVLEQLGAPQVQVRRGRHPSTRAHERLKQRLLQRRNALQERRAMIIQEMPGFWAMVVSFYLLCLNGECWRAQREPCADAPV